MGYWTHLPCFEVEDHPDIDPLYDWSIVGIVANHYARKRREWWDEHREEMHELARNSGK